MASRVTTSLARKTSGWASDYSHKNPGWQLAWDDFLGSKKPCVIDMRVAMQQIIEDDPWMDEPMVNEDEMLAAADDAVGEDW